MPFQQKVVGYSWTDGTPDAVGSDDHAGVYADKGTFELKVTSSGSEQHVLKLYIGAFCKTAALTAVAGKHTASKTLPRWMPEPTPCDHTGGALNVMFEVMFTGDLSVTWQVVKTTGGKESDEESDGNLTWQAAALAVSTNATACALNEGVCISDPQVLAKGSTVDLSAMGKLDWVHYGVTTSKAVAPFFQEAKEGGPRALKASLVGV